MSYPGHSLFFFFFFYRSRCILQPQPTGQKYLHVGVFIIILYMYILVGHVFRTFFSAIFIELLVVCWIIFIIKSCFIGLWNCNDNGRLLPEFCTEQQLLITNILFQQRDRLKTTWMHPRSLHSTSLTTSLYTSVTSRMSFTPKWCPALNATLIIT